MNPPRQYRNEAGELTTACEFCKAEGVELGALFWDLAEGWWLSCEDCATKRHVPWEPQEQTNRDDNEK